MSAENLGWVETIAQVHGTDIVESDPTRQAKMTSSAKTWRKWHPDNEDVTWVLQQYPAGIDRSDLADLASDGLDTSAARRRTFVATIMWGAGTTNRYQGRHRELLTDAHLAEALATSVEHLSKDGHIEAFKVMDRLPGITHRFHTKWLWVAGRALGTRPLPLVFDNQVGGALRSLQWPGMSKRQAMPVRWLAYLQDAAALADLVGATPEHVEYWLFSDPR